MHKTALLVSALALSTLVTGCVGTGPNTEQGAVAGGALGALAGAIIGHNSHGGNAVGGAVLGAAAGALAGGTIGNSVDHERGTIYGERRTVYDRPPAYDRQPAYVSAPPPPPAPPAETIPTAPAPNALWIPGYWTFDGTRYTWTGGRWEIPPPNARTYVAAHWENQGGTPVFVQGSWR
jgi:hypothetical protein